MPVNGRVITFTIAVLMFITCKTFQIFVIIMQLIAAEYINQKETTAGSRQDKIISQ